MSARRRKRERRQPGRSGGGSSGGGLGRIWPRSSSAAGVVMLMQPVSIDLYSYSLVTMLTGTVMFIIVTKFPD